jgi:hypothetical protein
MNDDEVVTPEYELDLNNLPKVKHNWVRRGIVVSCENAGHPNHRHFLTQKRDVALDAKRIEKSSV